MDWRGFFLTSFHLPILPFRAGLFSTWGLEIARSQFVSVADCQLGTGEALIRGRNVMHTQFQGSKMKKWAGIIVTLLFMTVFLVPITQAEEVAYRSVYHVQKGEMIEVGDVPGHFVGFSETPGIIFMTKGPASGEIGTRKAIAYYDTVKGKGPLTGYLTYTFPDGSIMRTKAIGMFTPVDGGKRSALEGTWECIGGTGRFEGMKGKGTWKGERVGPLETGADGYVDVTGTIGK
ncbi:MAG: hypothetical protein H6Q80_625 [Deltaproteobacteria bacterium]|nr:hypothetical protein [Deltaproteobacteria bacterium]